MQISEYPHFYSISKFHFSLQCKAKWGNFSLCMQWRAIEYILRRWLGGCVILLGSTLTIISTCSLAGETSLGAWKYGRNKCHICTQIHVSYSGLFLHLLLSIHRQWVKLFHDSISGVGRWWKEQRAIGPIYQKEGAALIELTLGGRRRRF